MAKLVAPNPVANDQFGFSVSISQDTVAIGSRLSDSATADQIGAVYMFTGIDTDADGSLDDWSDVTRLTASDALANDRFGTSVALDGDYLLVGAPGRAEFGDKSGIAYSFTRNAVGFWLQQARLFNENTISSGDEFGISVAVDEANRQGVVGAWRDDVPGLFNPGTATVFDLF